MNCVDMVGYLERRVTGIHSCEDAAGGNDTQGKNGVIDLYTISL